MTGYTVKELIQELGKYPDDAWVYLAENGRIPPVHEISYVCSDMNDNMENDNMNCNKCNDKCENNNGKSVERLIKKLNKNHMDSVELNESIRQKIKEKEIILDLPITLIDVDYDEIRIDVSTKDEYLDLDKLDDFIEELGVCNECVCLDALHNELIIKISI